MARSRKSKFRDTGRLSPGEARVAPCVDPELRMAVHELGHALVGLRKGVKVHGVHMILPDDAKSAGRGFGQACAKMEYQPVARVEDSSQLDDAARAVVRAEALALLGGLRR
jgi:hypothetical protein